MKRLLVVEHCKCLASQTCHSLRHERELCQASQGLHLHADAAVHLSLDHCLHHGNFLTSREVAPPIGQKLQIDKVQKAFLHLHYGIGAT